MKMSKIICLVGPTATGKTKISIELAKYFNAVIINADSTAVYKEPLIATAKITESEKENIKHYMLDLVSLNDDYTLFDYQKEGRKILEDLINENKNVIIVGGSGLYIKALLYDYDLKEVEKIDLDLSKYTNAELKSMADKIDSNNSIHINNRQRLERYIKKYHENNETLLEANGSSKRKYDFELIGLRTDRDTLYTMINNRVDKMFKEGLLDEAERLYKLNLKNYTNIIGYRELNMYFKNEISLEEASDLIKRNTRRYAKRQFTWFNNQMKDITWFDVNYNDIDTTINEIKEYLKNKTIN